MYQSNKLYQMKCVDEIVFDILKKIQTDDLLKTLSQDKTSEKFMQQRLKDIIQLKINECQQNATNELKLYIQELSNDNRDLMEMCTNLKLQIKELTIQNENIEKHRIQEVEDLNERIQKYVKTVSQLRSQNTKLAIKAEELQDTQEMLKLITSKNESLEEKWKLAYEDEQKTYAQNLEIKKQMKVMAQECYDKDQTFEILKKEIIQLSSVKEQNQSLNQQISEYQLHVATLNEELLKADKKMNESILKTKEVEGELRAYQQQYFSEKNVLMRHSEEKERQIMELKRLHEKEQDKKSWLEQINEKELTHREQILDLEMTIEDIKQMHQKNIEQQKYLHIKDLNNQEKEFYQQSQKLENEISSLKIQIDNQQNEFQEERQEYQNQLQRQGLELADKEGKCEILKNQITDLEIIIVKLKDKHGLQIQSIEESDEKLKFELEHMKKLYQVQRNDHQQEQNENLRQQTEFLLKDNEQQSQITEYKQLCKVVQEQQQQVITQLKEEKEISYALKIQLQNEKDQSKHALESIKIKEDEFNQVTMQQTQIIEELKQEIKKLDYHKDLIDRNSILRKKIQDLQDEILQKNSQIDGFIQLKQDLKTQNNQKEQEVHEISIENQKLRKISSIEQKSFKSELIQQQHENSYLKSEIVKLKQINIELDELNNKNELKTQDLKKENEQLLNQQGSLQLQLKNLKEQLQTQTNLIQYESQELKNEMDSLQQENYKLNQELLKVNALMQKKVIEKVQLEQDCQSQTSELQKKIHEKQMIIDQLSQKSIQEQQELKSTNALLQKKIVEKNQLKLELETKIERLESELIIQMENERVFNQSSSSVQISHEVQSQIKAIIEQKISIDDSFFNSQILNQSENSLEKSLNRNQFKQQLQIHENLIQELSLQTPIKYDFNQ